MSTNNSRDILACSRQVLSREQREGERQRPRVNTRRASEDDRQRERVGSRRRRQNFGEESWQVERVRARRRRESYSEECRQGERDRARMNRQRQRETEKYKGKENGSKIMTWWQKVHHASRVASTFPHLSRKDQSDSASRVRKVLC